MGKDVKHFRASMGVAKGRQMASHIRQYEWMTRGAMVSMPMISKTNQ